MTAEGRPEGARAKRASLTPGTGRLRCGRHTNHEGLNTRHRGWFRYAASFLGGYLDRAANTRILRPSDAELEMLLHFFLVEKVIYEIDYELNNRPDWVDIPLRGLLALLP